MQVKKLLSLFHQPAWCCNSALHNRAGEVLWNWTSIGSSPIALQSRCYSPLHGSVTRLVTFLLPFQIYNFLTWSFFCFGHAWTLCSATLWYQANAEFYLTISFLASNDQILKHIHIKSPFYSWNLVVAKQYSDVLPITPFAAVLQCKWPLGWTMEKCLDHPGFLGFACVFTIGGRMRSLGSFIQPN